MRRLDRELRKLDPIDPATPEPDGERLLQRIISEPAPPVRKPLRRRLFELAPVGLAVAAVAAVLLVAGLYDGAGGEREVSAPPDGAPSDVSAGFILHYKQRWAFRGPGGATATRTLEVWQAGDGSRLRVVHGPAGTSTFYAERATTGQGTRRLFERRGQPNIIDHDRSDPGALGAPAGYGVPLHVGDPRTLPARAAAGDPGVERLGAATVRDARVDRFRTGACPRALDVEDPDALTSAAASRPLIVSVAQDTLRPVRVETVPCSPLDAALGPPAPLRTGVEWPDMPWAATDYLSFELLPPTPENRRLLEFPGGRAVNGNPAATPAPSPR